MIIDKQRNNFNPDPNDFVSCCVNKNWKNNCDECIDRISECYIGQKSSSVFSLASINRAMFFHEQLIQFKGSLS